MCSFVFLCASPSTVGSPPRAHGTTTAADPPARARARLCCADHTAPSEAALVKSVCCLYNIEPRGSCACLCSAHVKVDVELERTKEEREGISMRRTASG